MSDNSNRQIRSFRNEIRSIKNEIYDTSKTLTYEEGLSVVRRYMEEETAKAIDESAKLKKDNVVIEKNKAYLKKRMDEYTQKIHDIAIKEELRIKDMTREEFVATCTSELEGHDILEDAFKDDEVTDIFVYRWNKIYIEKDGENVLYSKIFRNEKHYSLFLKRLAREAATIFDNGSHKIVDFELWGDRYCLVNKTIAPAGDTLTIRKHSESHITLNDLLKWRVMDDNVSEFFRIAIKGQTNIIYAGITGSGKTTDYRALYDAYIPELNRRVLTCEDTRELYLSNAQTLELVSFKAKESDSNVDLSRLVHTSLRLKPKYILVGEVRGYEAEAAIEGMATGHACGFTAHADKEIDTVNRLVINYQKAMPMLGSDIVERIVGNSIDLVVIKKNIPGTGRKITSISEIGYNDELGRVKIIPIMKYSYGEEDSFIFKNTFSEPMKEKMYGAGVTVSELKKWEEAAGVYDRAS